MVNISTRDAIIATVVVASIYNMNKENDEKKNNSRNLKSRDNSMREIILNSNPKLDSGIRRKRKIKEINLDKITFEKDSEGKIINGTEKTSTKVIGRKVSLIPYYQGIEIFGGSEIRSFDIRYNDRSFGENRRKQSFISINKEDNESIKISSKSEIVKIFEDRGFKLSEEDIELIYYKPETLNRLIPMYRVGSIKNGPVTKNGDHVLGSIFPSNKKYENNFQVENFQITRGSKINYKNIGDEGQKVSKSLYNYSATLRLSQINDERIDINRVNLIGNIKNAKKPEFLRDGSIKFHLIGDLESRKNNKILVNYLNKYDVSATRITNVFNNNILSSKNKIGKVIKPNTNFTRPNTNFTRPNTNFIRPRGDNNDYGIEWGEDVIGGSCYSNFVNYMDDIANANAMYKWTKPFAWKNDFWDKDKANGLDHLYVDDVDTSVIIAHGNGDGFTMEGSGVNNGKVKYDECAEGKAWGNIDLEFQIWLSCQVLEEDWGSPNLKWHQRWGPTFNGMHLICGFETNANVGTHKQLEHFARFSQGDKKTIRQSWFDAGDLDQPDGRRLVVMGPCINQSTSGDYKSINYEGVKVAYYNDKSWKAGSNAAGSDIGKSQIIGFWRVVHEV